MPETLEGQTTKSLAFLIIARMDSVRFPGKVVSHVQGFSLIEIIARRVAGCIGPDDRLMLATSDRPSDDLLETKARDIGLPVFRGDLSDVLGRVISAASLLGVQGVVRLNGDSPLVEPGVVAEAVNAMRVHPVDLVSTRGNGRLPYGVGAEVITLNTLRTLHRHACQSDREHITIRAYDNAKVKALHLPCTNWPSRPRLRLTVDSLDDLRVLATKLDEKGLDVLTCHYWDIADD